VPVEEIIEKLKQHAIPLDAIWLDIDHMQGYAPFLIDRKRYPELSPLFGIMKDRFVVRITDPHLPTQSHPMHNEDKARSFFVNIHS
jgi:alpha-glucosidase